MKKRNLLFTLFILGLGIGLFSCNMGSGKNVNQYPASYVVISDNASMGGITMGTIWGYFAAPSLVDVYPGDCLIVNQFTVDLDNQPAGKQYYTATNIDKSFVDHSFIEINDTVAVADYTLKPSNPGGISSAYYQGRFFIGFNSKDKNPALRLVYNRKELDNGIKNFYLLVQPSPSGTSASDVTTVHAFDLSSVIQNPEFGRDTTIVFSDYPTGIAFRYIKVNLNYLSDIAADGTPTFTKVQSPYEIYVFK